MSILTISETIAPTRRASAGFSFLASSRTGMLLGYVGRHDGDAALTAARQHRARGSDPTRLISHEMRAAKARATSKKKLVKNASTRLAPRAAAMILIVSI